MHYDAVARLVILIALANGAPVLAKLALGPRLAYPLDGNVNFFDGRPLFGSAKTIRGLAASLLATTACAPLLGVPFRVGLIVAATAMLGDLCSSFLKRRLGLAPSSKATGLDQIPESLFPLLACRKLFSLTLMDIVIGSALFFVGGVLLSQALFRLGVRDRPY